MFLSYFLNLTYCYMFCHYQEADKIVNLTVLDLLLLCKRKLIYGTTLYHKRDSRPSSWKKTFPRSTFYCSSNSKCCRLLNFFQFLFEGVIKRFIINYVCIVQMRSYKCFVDCKQLVP